MVQLKYKKCNISCLLFVLAIALKVITETGNNESINVGLTLLGHLAMGKHLVQAVPLCIHPSDQLVRLIETQHNK